MGDLLAIDWGTTNRRVYRLSADGAVLATDRDDTGVLAMRGRDWAAELAAIRARSGDLPVLAAGMVGSNIGWRDAGYVSTPADLPALAAAAVEAGERAWIVPGVSHVADGRADVMRGEEVQLLGAAAAGLVPDDALLCQPGTHCKWARVTGGRITGFATAMTGELFALLKGHGLLAQQLTAPVEPGPAFDRGVEDARGGDLLGRLFGIRAAAVLGLRGEADHASYASGLLIGSDVAARMAAHDGAPVRLLADPALGALYAAALAAHGVETEIVDSRDAFVAGIARLWSLIR